MVIDPVDDEIWVPGWLSIFIEQLVESLQTFLPEVVSEDLETHQCLIMAQGLGKEIQAEIVDLVVSHIDMEKRFVLGNSLSDGFSSVVRASVAGKVKGLKRAVWVSQILCNGLTSLEGNFIGIQVKDLKCVIFQQVLHDDKDSITPQLMLSNTELLETNVVLEHFTKVNGDTLADGLINRVVKVQLLKSVIGAVENREDTDDSIVVNLVVTEVELEELVMSEEQFCNHHSTVSFDLVVVEVEVLKTSAVFESISKVLSSIGLDPVPLQIQTQKSW